MTRLKRISVILVSLLMTFSVIAAPAPAFAANMDESQTGTLNQTNPEEAGESNTTESETLPEEVSTGVISLRLSSDNEGSKAGIVFCVYYDTECTEEIERIAFSDEDASAGLAAISFGQTVYVKEIETNDYYKLSESVTPVVIDAETTILDVTLEPVEQASEEAPAEQEEDTPSKIVPAATYPCDTPVLTSISNTKEGVKISWEPVEGAAYYRVFRKKDDAAGWKKLADISSDKTEYVITEGLVEGKLDRYTVRCLDKSKNFASSFDSTGLTMMRIAPATFTLSSVDSSVKIDITVPENMDGAVLYRKSSGDKDETLLTRIYGTGAQSYIDEGIVRGKENTYFVQTFKEVGEDTYLSSPDVSSKITCWLPNPVLVSAKNSSTGITLTWEAVPGAYQYQVFRKAEGTSKWKTAGKTFETSYKDTASIKAGIKYYYTVRCINEDGSWASKYDTTGKSAKRLLAKPSLISAENDYGGGIEIRWEPVTGAEEYRVFRRASTTATWKNIGSTASTSFVDKSSLTDYKDYYYTVRCISTDGKTFQSSYNSTGLTVNKQPLTTARMISAVQTKDGIKVSWYKVYDASKYRLYRKKGSSGAWEKLADVSGTSYTDTKSHSKGVIYFYSVRCLSSGGSFTTSMDSTGVGLIYNSGNKAPEKSKMKYRNVVFFGDSWTKGSGSTSKAMRYTTRLASALQLKEYNFGVSGAGFIIKSKPFSAQLANADETMTQAEKNDTQYVFITGGVNDIRHYGSEAYYEKYSKAVCDVYRKALDMFPNATIVLTQGTLMQSGGLPAQHEMIEYCDKVLDSDVTSDRVIRIKNPGYLLAKSKNVYWRSDALHPSNIGHALFASYIYTRAMNGTMSTSQLIENMSPTSAVTAKTVSKLWRGTSTTYLKSGKYTTKAKIAAGNKTKIGTINAYCAPYKTVTGTAKSGTTKVGTISITPEGYVYFTSSKAFSGTFTVPKISWECLGADNT